MVHHKYFSTGLYKNTIKDVKDTSNCNNIPIPTLDFIGTIKLHGTNASVHQKMNDNSTIVCQSKENIITPEKDNAGFARFIDNINVKEILNIMFANIKNKFIQHTEHKTMVIYGEWCGMGIQKNVAINKLPKMFVIFAIKLIDNEADANNDRKEIWLSKEEIQEVYQNTNKTKLNSLSIYSIYDFPTYKIAINFSEPQLQQNELVDITLAVEKKCPVAAHFGVEGIGEGVVWKCITDYPIFKTRNLIFKVKGKDHTVSNVSSLAPVDTAKVNSIKEFVDGVVTENRLQQGLDYLKEMQLDVDKVNMGPFLKWIANDCIKEEADVMLASGLSQKEVMGAISNKAKQWFLNIYNQLDNVKEDHIVINERKKSNF